MSDIDKNIDNLYPLILSTRLIKILIKIDDIVSKKILQLYKINFLCNKTYIDKTQNGDLITFLPSHRIKDINDPINWTSNLRVEVKIGRLFKNILGDDITDQDLEKFINKYKSITDEKILNNEIQIVEGEEIRKWYYGKNYSYGGGNLNNSCMRHFFCQPFLDIYVNNPEKIKLLILLDNNNQTILGRALMWKLDLPDNKIFMDRVYCSHDYILNIFINHAIENNWFYKLKNMENIFEFLYNDILVKETMVVKIKKEKFEYFPFIDNLGFYDPNNSILTNNPLYLQKLGCDEYYDLCDEKGGFEIRRDFDF